MYILHVYLTKGLFQKYLKKDYPQRKGQTTQENGQATRKNISQKKMAKKHVKTHSISLVLREMPIK